MSARFCPRCEVKALPAAKFCSDCGASLLGGARPGWRLTTAGGGLVAFFLVTGLTIWTLILQP